MAFDKILGSLKKHHYIDIPAIIAVILSVIGIISSVISGFVAAAPNKIYSYLAIFGWGYEFGYSLSHNYFVALAMNLIADFIGAFIVYWIGWKAYQFFRKS